ncbi:MAG: hypothetical protein WC415_00860 [Patescibacteria group bacterium]|jgi:hypothetical protein
MHYKIASLILNSGQKPNTAADIFIAQPDGYKEALAGKLFVLAEIESPRNDGLKIINFLIGCLNSNYYDSEKIILKEKIETITVESIFEGALAKTNKDFTEFLEGEKIKTSPYSLNMTVGVLYQNELYLSSVGKNKNYLIYKEKEPLPPKRGQALLETEKIEYRATDLSQEKPAGEGIAINKIFSEISGGKIPTAGYFLTVNEAMSEYLSPKQLIKIATKLPPAAAMEQIKNTLEQVNSYVSFLGVLVKNTAFSTMNEEDLKKKTEKELERFDYKPEIVSIEEKTESVLAPSGFFNLKKRLDGIFKKPGQKNQAFPVVGTLTGRQTKIPFMLKDKVFFKRRPSFASPEKILDFFKKIFSGLGKLFSAIMKTSNYENEEESTGEKKYWSRNKIKFAALAIVIIAVVLSASLAITKQSNKNATALKTFNEKVSTIGKNHDKIEADLLYGNNVDAQALWLENQKILNQIPEKEKSSRETIIAFTKKQTELSEKIRLITRVSADLKITADFSKLNTAAAPQQLVLTSNIIYATDESSPTIYKVDLKENIVTASYDLPNIGGLDFLAIEKEDVYSLGSDGILKLNAQSQAEKLSISLPTEIKNIGGFQIYNSRVYLVDKQNSQIYRYNLAEGGFSGQTAWLNAKIDLANAANIFINGDIYILRQNGQVEKYLKGQKENFPDLPIEEPITEASRLIVGERKVYILEASKKRLAIFDFATGKLLNQYIFDKLSNVKDFSANEANKKIYILSGATIYEMDIL